MAALDKISAANGSLTVTESAKALKLQPRQLFEWLSGLRWIYRREGVKQWLGYQDKVQAGLLTHRASTVDDGDGGTRLYEQVRITGKGLARLSEMVIAGKMAAAV